MDSINSLNGKLGIEFEIALTDKDQLDFHEFPCIKEKNICKISSQCDSKFWILDTASLNI